VEVVMEDKDKKEKPGLRLGPEPDPDPETPNSIEVDGVRISIDLIRDVFLAEGGRDHSRKQIICHHDGTISAVESWRDGDQVIFRSSCMLLPGDGAEALEFLGMEISK
jgi:hypothetical protein